MLRFILFQENKPYKYKVSKLFSAVKSYRLIEGCLGDSVG